jgi:outer membrane receptor protein involved in Fe transport
VLDRWSTAGEIEQRCSVKSPRYWRINFNANINSAGTFAFDGSFTGLGLADFLTGKPNNYTQGGPNVIYMSQAYSGLYGQDTWKVTPRFTLTYGMRWEPYFPQILRNGTVYALAADDAD